MGRSRGRILGDTEREILLGKKTIKNLAGIHDRMGAIRKDAFNKLPEIIQGFGADLKILLNYPPTNYDKKKLEENKKAAQKLGYFARPVSIIELCETLEELDKAIRESRKSKIIKTPARIKKAFEKAEQIRNLEKKLRKNKKLNDFFANVIGKQIDTHAIPREGTKFEIYGNKKDFQMLRMLKQYGLVKEKENGLTQDGGRLLYIMKAFRKRN